jgi:16S rRNA (uracil1498-N3)-methyltransferase
MRRFFGREQGGKIVIEGDEYNHMRNVLRLIVGDEILVSLNDDYEYVCEIEKFAKNSAVCKVNGKNVCVGNPRKNIVIFQAITKGPKFEFIVQKATEIGISKVVPFLSEFVVAKVSESKMDRLQAIALNACKQCERTKIPEISAPIKFDDVLAQFKDFDIVLFANERASVGEKIKDFEKYQNIAIIVGSEGGFSQKEKERFEEAGATTISLGKRIYRCETASVAMMSLVSILSGN